MQVFYQDFQPTTNSSIDQQQKNALLYKDINDDKMEE